MADTKKCAHPMCSCMINGKTFCSQMCEDSDGTTSLGCDCQHAACAGRM